MSFVFVEVTMAEKKKPGRPPKKETVTYKGNKYTLLEEANGRCKLTDGTIHFWVKEKDVSRN